MRLPMGATVSQCQACAGRAELFLCAACVNQLRSLLQSLVQGPITGGTAAGPRRGSGLLEDLADVVLRRTKLGSGGAGGHRKRGDVVPGPYEPDTEDNKRTKQGEAAMLLDAIGNGLTTIVRDLCESRGITWRPLRSVEHGFIGPLMHNWWRLPVGYVATNTDLAGWLAAYVGAIASDESAGQWHNEIRAYVRRIERVIDRPIGRKFLGKCPTWDDHTRRICGRELNAPEDAIEVYCRACRATHNCDRLQLLLVNDLARKKLTAEQIREYQRRYLPPEFRVSERTLRHWIQHGRLKPRGYLRPDGSHGINQRNVDDEPLYLWRDIERLRAERPRKVGTQ
jgi:hypothetical protein